MKKIKKFINDHFEGLIIILVLIGVLGIAFLIHYKFDFLNFFLLPIILAGYFLGKRKAILIALFCIVLVILYLIFYKLYLGLGVAFSTDEMIRIATWGGFLILTAAIIGTFTEQRERRLERMRRSYFGALKIMLKYLEVADEEKPRSLRVSLLAGEIAKAAELSKTEVEDIKSAALLYEAGDLQSSLPFYEEIVNFISGDMKKPEEEKMNKEQVELSAMASLLKTIEPLLSGYYHHYVEEAEKLEKDLNEIPFGSSIIALANLYDKVANKVPTTLGDITIETMEDIEKLSGRSFSTAFVRALKETTGGPQLSPPPANRPETD
ncbi:MAG: hypothetical protein GTO16_14120 [Candidatus Aminicenantes bacterium]|nr:hypothetical protein [Candidatus Aminicenantes bacterium]